MYIYIYGGVYFVCCPRCNPRPIPRKESYPLVLAAKVGLDSGGVKPGVEG